MVHARGIWAAVRRHPVRTGLLAVSFVGVLLVLIAILSSVPPALPSFGFLAGRDPALTLRDQVRISRKHTQVFYSFTGDFQAVCDAAQAELSALGYAPLKTQPGVFFPTREYRLDAGSAGERVNVRIMAGAKLVVIRTPKNSQYVTPDRYTYEVERGWITVVVLQERRMSRLRAYVTWPVSRLLRKLGLWPQE